MSEIKRYDCELDDSNKYFLNAVMQECEQGDYVKYTDYQSLIADKQKEIASKTLKAIERENKIVLLEEEIERLREALISIRGWRELGCSDNFDRHTAQIFGNIADEALEHKEVG